jgi:predicted acylesterase/phospholipase RssA
MTMKQDGGPSTALILSGGGAYAAYEIGTMKALFTGQSPVTGYRMLRSNTFVGCSMGAVNAATIVAESDQELPTALGTLEDIWLNHYAANRGLCQEGAIRIRGDPAKYLSAECLARKPIQPLSWLLQDSLFFAREGLARMAALMGSQEPLARRALQLIDPGVLINRDDFLKIVVGSIDLAKIRGSEKLVRITATNWRTGHIRVFRNQDMTDVVGHNAISASATFPGLPPIMIEGEPYVDGGFHTNTPTRPAWDAGANTMHVIYMNPDISKIPLRRFDNVIDILDRLYHMMMATVFEQDIRLARDINRGLTVMEGAGGALAGPEMRGILRLAGRVTQIPSDLPPYRKLTIHRYFPTDDLGGSLGILNFDRDHIQTLINLGFRDAVEHDCSRNACLLPD